MYENKTIGNASVRMSFGTNNPMEDVMTSKQSSSSNWPYSQRFGPEQELYWSKSLINAFREMRAIEKLHQEGPELTFYIRKLAKYFAHKNVKLQHLIS